jgi:hypothetical protein
MLRSMTRAYGRNEAARSWYDGCGWVWTTAKETTKILESLHRRGLVEKTVTHIMPTRLGRRYAIGREHDRVTYSLTELGRKTAAEEAAR